MKKLIGFSMFLLVICANASYATDEQDKVCFDRVFRDLNLQASFVLGIRVSLGEKIEKLMKKRRIKYSIYNLKLSAELEEFNRENGEIDVQVSGSLVTDQGNHFSILPKGSTSVKAKVVYYQRGGGYDREGVPLPIISDCLVRDYTLTPGKVSPLIRIRNTASNHIIDTIRQPIHYTFSSIGN